MTIFGGKDVQLPCRLFLNPPILTGLKVSQIVPIEMSRFTPRD
jgi:hypothetical protein